MKHNSAFLTPKAWLAPAITLFVFLLNCFTWNNSAMPETASKIKFCRKTITDKKIWPSETNNISLQWNDITAALMARFLSGTWRLHFINKSIFPNVSRETRPNNVVMRVLSAENHWRSLKFQVLRWVMHRLCITPEVYPPKPPKCNSKSPKLKCRSSCF